MYCSNQNVRLHINQREEEKLYHLNSIPKQPTKLVSFLFPLKMFLDNYFSVRKVVFKFYLLMIKVLTNIHCRSFSLFHKLTLKMKNYCFYLPHAFKGKSYMPDTGVGEVLVGHAIDMAGGHAWFASGGHKLE